jgi:hypothetical protein
MSPYDTDAYDEAAADLAAFRLEDQRYDEARDEIAATPPTPRDYFVALFYGGDKPATYEVHYDSALSPAQLRDLAETIWSENGGLFGANIYEDRATFEAGGSPIALACQRGCGHIVSEPPF